MLSLVWAAILGPQRSIVKVRVLPFCPNLHRLEAAPRGPRREDEAEFGPEHRVVGGHRPGAGSLPSVPGVVERPCRT